MLCIEGQGPDFEIRKGLFGLVDTLQWHACRRYRMCQMKVPARRYADKWDASHDAQSGHRYGFRQPCAP